MLRCLVFMFVCIALLNSPLVISDMVGSSLNKLNSVASNGLSIQKLERGNDSIVGIDSNGCIFFKGPKDKWDNLDQSIFSESEEPINVSFINDSFFLGGDGGLLARLNIDLSWEKLSCVKNSCLLGKNFDVELFKGSYIVASSKGIAKSNRKYGWKYMLGGTKSKRSFLFHDLIVANDFVLASGPFSYISKDGEAWERIFVPEGMFNLNWNGKKYIGINKNKLMVSEDLEYWNSIYEPPEGVTVSLFSVKEGDYWISGSKGFLAKSKNLKDWTVIDTRLEGNIGNLVVHENWIMFTEDLSVVLESTENFEGGYSKQYIPLEKNQSLYRYLIQDGKVEKVDFLPIKKCEKYREGKLF